MNMSVRFDMREAIKGLNMSVDGAEKVVKRTVSDMRSRAPGWVSNGVREEYNIASKDIKSAMRIESGGTMKIRGVAVDQIALVYRGKLLTYIHFGMRVAKRGPYPISVEVHKGKRMKLKGKSEYEGKPFIARSGRENTVKIPFQREGRRRLPIHALKSISIPQMIMNTEGLKESVDKNISEGLQKRFENHCNHYLKSE